MSSRFNSLQSQPSLSLFLPFFSLSPPFFGSAVLDGKGGGEEEVVQDFYWAARGGLFMAGATGSRDRGRERGEKGGISQSLCEGRC